MPNQTDIPDWIIDQADSFTEPGGSAVRLLIEQHKNLQKQIKDLKSDLADCKAKSRMGLKQNL